MELGWELMGWSGYIRYLSKQEAYKEYKVFVMTHPGRYPIYHDFAHQIVPLPNWYLKYGLESASYDAVGITPEIYSELIKYFRRFYYDDTESQNFFEVRPPRGHTMELLRLQPQLFKKLSPTEIGINIRNNLLGGAVYNNIVVVMPRYRIGVTQDGNQDFSLSRNWHPLYWQELIKYLSNDGYLVVVAGTRNGIPDINYNFPNVINLSALDSTYILDTTLAFMEVAIGNICSQSGGTHLSLQAYCPTWCLGHEKQRHAIDCNFLKTPCMFLECGLPYSIAPFELVYESVSGFLKTFRGDVLSQRLSAVNPNNNITRECFVCGSGDCSSQVKDFVECASCGTFRKRIIPNKETIINQLRGMRLGYMLNENSLIERTKEAEYQLSILNRFSHLGLKASSPDYWVYDVGCGDGTFLNVAEKLGWKVNGNEVSEFAVNLGKSRYGYNLQYGMLEDQVNINNYDAFVLWHTLEHTLNPKSTVQYCYDHLLDSGIIQIAVPIKTKEEMGGSRYEDLHTHEFTVNSLKQLVTSCGFSIVYEETRSPNNDTQVHIVGRKN